MLDAKTPEKQAVELIDTLSDAIYESHSGTAKGMPYREWRAFAVREVATVIREAELRARSHSEMDLDVWMTKISRISFLMLAATFSFGSFWGGIIYTTNAYGPVWGIACALTGVVIAIAFGLAAQIE